MSPSTQPDDLVMLRSLVGLGVLSADAFKKACGFEAHVPTEEESAEACFTKAVLGSPEDDLSRKVYADWLDEHGRPEQAAYLREIGRDKFVRRVRWYGAWALKPLPPMPPGVPVGQLTRYWIAPPPNPSPRSLAWLWRIRIGWRPSRRVRGLGYESAAHYFRVYYWEYLNVISPLL